MKIYMSFYKNNVVSKMLMYSMMMLPTPMNINLWWNFGSILGIFLMIQIVSGFILSMHYCPSTDLAFNSIIYIMKDIKYGWITRLIHMNGASFYFVLMYLHISRNLFYHSYKLSYVWVVGVTILFLSMATAFLGYVLPWGQMSFWGATVITNLMSAIPYFGQVFVEWIWGGFTINNSTLNRFFSLHFILPLVIFLLVVTHLFMLHLTGSSNPLGMKSDMYKIPFHFYYSVKDLLGIIIILVIYVVVILQIPYYLGDPDNFKIANSMSTPIHIKPEWYFLFAYSILRSISNKLGGVIMMLFSILILYTLPVFANYSMKSNKFYPLSQILYWLFINNFIMLTWLGMQMIEQPFIMLNKIFTMMYFMYFLLTFYLNTLWDKIIK